jgi:hypothetical protein
MEVTVARRCISNSVGSAHLLECLTAQVNVWLRNKAQQGCKVRSVSVVQQISSASTRCWCRGLMCGGALAECSGPGHHVQHVHNGTPSAEHTGCLLLVLHDANGSVPPHSSLSSPYHRSTSACCCRHLRGRRGSCRAGCRTAGYTSMQKSVTQCSWQAAATQ